MKSFITFTTSLHEAQPDGWSQAVQGLSIQSARTLAHPEFWSSLAQGLREEPYIQQFRTPVVVVSLTNYREILGYSRAQGLGVYMEMKQWQTATWKKAHYWSFSMNRGTNTRVAPTGIFVTAGYSTTWNVGAGRRIAPSRVIIDDAREYQGLYNVGGDPTDGKHYAVNVLQKIDLYLKRWK